MPKSPKSIFATVAKISRAHGDDPTELVAMLSDIQDFFRFVPDSAMADLAEILDLPLVKVKGVASFYHFLSTEHSGQNTIYFNTSATAEIAGIHEIIRAFETELGIKLGETTKRNRIGLRTTSCIGMSDQEPAAIINGKIFPRLKVKEVRALIKTLHSGKLKPHRLTNIVQKKGPVFFDSYRPGVGLKKAFTLGSDEIIEIIKSSGLRGRGGAGFPTGQKWAICKSTPAATRFVFCNADEGEPGTFKDRVLLSLRPEMIFESMAVAGYAIGAKQGFLYLRAEYSYLRASLENTLNKMRRDARLGKRILGSRFSFDIKIKQGAGAYICGEESALLESAEGHRGQPRNRPPYPVTSGYLNYPTIVNNPETLVCALKIIKNGSDWFRSFGTESSPGVKLHSVAGDCPKPGVYELPWGVTVQKILELCGAKDVRAVQVGGPSGTLVPPDQFNRKLCFSDLSTGGAFTVFDNSRDILSIIRNHTAFFMDESCGFCVPCRAGNRLLLKSLEKIIAGKGTRGDLAAIRELSGLVKSTSRCGLGQTSPNPILNSLDFFASEYEGIIRDDVEYLSQFSLENAVADSCALAKKGT